jgi:predicted kinase
VEFNRRIRLVDVARDVGFLAMDLDYRDAPRFGETFVDRYVQVSGDEEMREIIDFYRSYNACVRGKVDGFRLSQPEVPAAEKRQARAAARRYFQLACRYAESLPPALLIITCGLAGAGKSTVARSVARAAGAEIISSDFVRKELLGVAPGERHFDEYGKGLYAAGLRERTYEAMFERARPLLMAGRSVVLDASFIRRDQRRRAARVARETGAQYACVEVMARPSEVRRRLDARLRRGVSASDGRWEIYVGQQRQFQRPTEVPPERRLVVDSEKPVKAEVRAVIEGLRRLSPLSLRRRR